eukprot:scaffold190223_cov41-Prasinocladus_malaysianus.AAC.1
MGFVCSTQQYARIIIVIIQYHHHAGMASPNMATAFQTKARPMAASQMRCCEVTIRKRTHQA